MTRHHDLPPAVGDRLRAAFAEELDRPGLEGPALDAVLRAGLGRVRRRRTTFGATFAVAAAAAVGVGAVTAPGGPTPVSTTSGGHGGETASSSTSGPTGSPANSPTGSPTAQGGPRPGETSLPSSPSGSPSTTPTSAAWHPADFPLSVGTVKGHSWKSVRGFVLIHPDPDGKTYRPAAADDPDAKWCSRISLSVDGKLIQSGNGAGDLNTNTNGIGDCVVDGKVVHSPLDPYLPGFTAMDIVDAAHHRYGTVVAGEVDAKTTKVIAECADGQNVMTTPTRAPDDSAYYYAFTFPEAANCRSGNLAFYDASGESLARLTGLTFGTPK